MKVKEVSKVVEEKERGKERKGDLLRHSAFHRFLFFLCFCFCLFCFVFSFILI